METEYKAYQERRKRRIKIGAIFTVCWVVYSVLAVWFYYGTGIFGLFVLIGFLGFMMSARYVESHYWISEPSEKKIFMNLYRSLEFIGLCSEDNEEENKLYLGKAVKHVKNGISELGKMCILEKANSKLFDKEFASRLKRLRGNLKDRILSRIMKSEDLPRIISVLHELAEFFGEIEKSVNLNELDLINEKVETYKKMPFRERAIKPMFKKALVSKPSQFIFSIFLGYFSITIITWVFSQFLTIDFAEFMRSNLIGVISGGAVLSGIIASLFILKK